MVNSFRFLLNFFEKIYIIPIY